MKYLRFLTTAVACAATLAPTFAGADSWDVRREWREGARNVAREQREAAREIERCGNRKCVVHEIREGQREVDRERREAWREVQRERAENHYRRYGRHAYDDVRYFRGATAHYHPGGRYCTDARHVVHLRDAYYRGDRRWYRDARYWNEYDYVTRYYRGYDRHDDDDDLVKGILIGAAVVGVIAAIHETNDGD
ncbi:MAG TPA: hypothetical protein VNS57_00680 [Steroidobacteraceae bacterium]|nr:hypothetical protein [Steroidobacteraceae bacterium]